MSYTLPLGIRRPPNETGLTVLCTLSDDDGQTPLAGSVDLGSFIEVPLVLSDGSTVWAVRYGRSDVPIPNGFDGVAVFHTGTVGAAADFSGVDVLAIMPIVSAVSEGVRARKGVAFTLDFVMVLAADHVSVATGKTVSATISKDGGAFAASANSVTEIGGGVYTLALTAAEMNADRITLKASASLCDDRLLTIYTQP